MIKQLMNLFPLTEPQITGEENQKEFIFLFGAILRMRNLLTSFDQFQEKDLQVLISEENLKPEETRRFLDNAFRDGEIGTDIDQFMPPVSKFGKSGRAQKKQKLIEKLKAFFEKYFGISERVSFTKKQNF